MANLYENVDAGHYYDSIRHGNRVQRFWQKQKFKQVLKHVKNNSEVLDIGCGPGVFLSMLQRSCKGSGIDVSEGEINFAKLRFKGFDFKAADAAKKIPFKKKFDYIVMIEVIEHLDAKEATKLIANAKGVLKKGGRLIITTPNYSSLWPLIELLWSKLNPIDYSSHHINKFSVKRLSKFIQSRGLKLVEIETYFILAPFFALLSERLAEMLMKIEGTLMPRFGSLILLEAVK